MEIILKQDITSLGYENEIVNVKPGFARNFLIPKGMAVIASETNKKIVGEVQRQKSFKEDKLRDEATTKAKLLDKVTLTIGAKVGTSGKIFGSVNAIQIADALKEKKFDIDRKRIDVDGDAIKEVGEYKATINLYKEIKATVKFEVVAE